MGISSVYLLVHPFRSKYNKFDTVFFRINYEVHCSIITEKYCIMILKVKLVLKGKSFCIVIVDALDIKSWKMVKTKNPFVAGQEKAKNINANKTIGLVHRKKSWQKKLSNFLTKFQLLQPSWRHCKKRKWQNLIPKNIYKHDNRPLKNIFKFSKKIISV